MTRDVEDALADLYNQNKLNPKAGKKNHVNFKDLPSFLHGITDRWNEVHEDNFKPGEFPCFKSLFQVFTRLKSNPAKLMDLMNERKSPDVVEDKHSTLNNDEDERPREVKQQKTKQNAYEDKSEDGHSHVAIEDKFKENASISSIKSS